MYSPNFVLLVTALTSLLPTSAVALCQDKRFTTSARPAVSQPSYPDVSYPNPSSNTRCHTSFGSSSVPWASSTTWSTQYSACTTTTRIISTITAAPSSVTTTVTVSTTTTTTAPTSSLTSTTTVTSSVTSTTTTTNTAYSTTSTTVIATATTTKPTNSGFIPVQTSLPGATCDNNCGPNPATRRLRRGFSPSNSNDSDKRADTSPNFNQSPALYGRNQHQHQHGVRCYQYETSATCVTSTVSSTMTVQGQSTGTVTSTITSTITSTVNPSATVTTTTISTTTVTTTATTSTTETVTKFQTDYPTTTTIYAACGPSNMADVVNGKRIQSLQATNGNDQSGFEILGAADAPTAYDCCVTANTDVNVGKVWEFSGNACIIYNNNKAQCSAKDPFTANYSGATTYVIVGNTDCGVVSSSGAVTG